MRAGPIVKYGTFRSAKNYESKLCGECQTRTCEDGLELKLLDRPNYHRYVCKKCIGHLRAPLVREHLKIGTLSGPQVASFQAGVGCSQRCATASAGVCSGARRALLRASELEESETGEKAV